MGINAKCIKREVNKKCVEIAKTNHKTKTNKITEAMEWFLSIECSIFIPLCFYIQERNFESS